MDEQTRCMVKAREEKKRKRTEAMNFLLRAALMFGYEVVGRSQYDSLPWDVSLRNRETGVVLKFVF